jgi:hypothetical protein
MAIAFDAVASLGSPGYVFGQSTWSYNHTCTGSDRLLCAYVVVDDSGGTTERNPGVTFNGTSFTRVDLGGTGGRFTDAGNRMCYFFFLLAPDAGTFSLVTTLDSTCVIGLTASASYTGVKQSAQPDSAAGTDRDVGNTGTTTATVTTTADNAWFIAGAIDNFGYTGITMNTGTRRGPTVDSGLSAMDFGPQTPAGSASISYTDGPGKQISIWGAAFAPVSAAAGNPWNAYAQQ